MDKEESTIDVVDVEEKMTAAKLLAIVNDAAGKFEKDNPAVEIDSLFYGCRKEASITLKEKKNADNS